MTLKSVIQIHRDEENGTQMYLYTSSLVLRHKYNSFHLIDFMNWTVGGFGEHAIKEEV